MLADLLGVRAQGALVRSRFQTVAQMDAPSKLFNNLEINSLGLLIYVDVL